MARAPTAQIELLSVIIHESRRFAPPTVTRLRELTGKPHVRLTVGELIRKGKVRQEYDAGPILPLETWEGESLALRLEPEPSWQRKMREVLSAHVTPADPQEGFVPVWDEQDTLAVVAHLQARTAQDWQASTQSAEGDVGFTQLQKRAREAM
jgi:hypothetical protein